MSTRLVVALTLAASAAGCGGKREEPSARKVADTPPAAPAPTPPAVPPPAPAPPAPPAPMPASVPGCTPVAPLQRAGKATITVTGEGLDVRAAVVPAICGALHTEATKRFAVGDGTLFKACLPDGNTFSISADVQLTGPQRLTFTYEDYKKKSALIELNVAGKGTYNQRDEPGPVDSLGIAYDWHTAEVHIDLVWPSKKDRLVHVDAGFDCGGPIRTP